MRRLLRKRRPVLVLGCGPAGLFAAHAAVSLGYEVAVWSQKRQSPLYGAQYLHTPIPGLGDHRSIEVLYALSGTTDGYQEKVYGPMPVPFVSPQRLLGYRNAWDIRSAYNDAVATYWDRVVNLKISGRTIEMLARTSNPPLIINSIPLQHLCLKPGQHFFTQREIWAAGDAPDLGISCPVEVPPARVQLDGTPDVSWYRASNVFSHRTVEWAGETKPPLSGVARVRKPIDTNCDCHRDMLRVGRYGKWKKGVLSHEAYTDVLTALGGGK